MNLLNPCSSYMWLFEFFFRDILTWVNFLIRRSLSFCSLLFSSLILRIYQSLILLLTPFPLNRLGRLAWLIWLTLSSSFWCEKLLLSKLLSTDSILALNFSFYSCSSALAFKYSLIWIFISRILVLSWITLLIVYGLSLNFGRGSGTSLILSKLDLAFDLILLILLVCV